MGCKMYGWCAVPVLAVALAVQVSGVVAANDGDVQVARFVELGQPFETPADLDPLLEAIGEVPYVLLGESTHGTSEYYHWRDQISRRLIEEKGFRFIAVEGDWEACYRLNRYVKHLPGAGESARAILESFDRWPLWMWANEEVETLVEWLREHNADKPEDERVGFYGIDVYGMADSLDAVLAYLREVDGEGAARAEEAYACLKPYAASFSDYARAVHAGVTDCAEAAASVVEQLAENSSAYAEEGRPALFNAKMNALVVKNAEAHYRAMAEPGGASWNARVDHFHETVEQLTDYKGEGARGVVWAHNTHIGDARATAMGNRGQYNIGQLLRERHGTAKVFAVGFGTYQGTVLAGRAWEAPMERMTIPPGMTGSTEALMHRAAEELDADRFFLVFEPGDLNGVLGEWRGHRAVGVTYNPLQEQGNYVPTNLPLRYDGFLFFRETRALTPVHGP